MDYELDVAAILRRGEQLFGHKTIVSRLPDKSWHTYTYADFARRSKQLALALRNELGLVDGDRVATFAWNHHEHLETYIGAPVGGFVTHTLNLRLHPDDLTYIANHAGDRVLIADKVLWPLVEAFKDRVGFEHIIAIGAGETPPGAIDFEELLATADAEAFVVPRHRRARGGGDVLHERHHRPAEGRRLLAPRDRDPLARLDASRARSGSPSADAVPARRADVPRERVGLPVHVHARRRRSRSSPGRTSIRSRCSTRSSSEEVTVTAGVPTIWMGILQALDAEPGPLGPVARCGR